MTGDDLFEAFITRLSTNGDAAGIWWNKWNTKRWTSTLTAATADAVLSVVPGPNAKREVAAKGRRDRYRRSEYLSLDVIGYQNDWGPPLVAVELENTAWKPKYCAWKLLSVDARLRVLIAYVDPAGNHPKYKANAADLVADLREVTAAQPGKGLHLFCGEWGADPRGSEGWRAVFSHHVVADDALP